MIIDSYWQITSPEHWDMKDLEIDDEASLMPPRHLWHAPESLREWYRPLMVVRNSGRWLDLLNFGGMPLVSERLRDTIGGFEPPAAIRWLPVDVLLAALMEHREYYSAYVVTPLDCLDVRGTTFFGNPWTSPTFAVAYHMAVSEDCVKSRHVFTETRSPTHLIISDQVRLAILDLDPVGVRFNPVDLVPGSRIATLWRRYCNWAANRKKRRAGVEAHQNRLRDEWITHARAAQLQRIDLSE